MMTTKGTPSCMIDGAGSSSLSHRKALINEYYFGRRQSYSDDESESYEEFCIHRLDQIDAKQEID